MRRMLGIALGGLLILGACGDDDDEPAAEDTSSEAESGGDSDADAYIDAAAAQFMEGDDELTMDEESARCIAAAGINTLGVDALTEAGVTPEELADAEDFTELDVEIPDDAVEDMAAALEECNLGDVFGSVLTDSLAAEGAELPGDAATCLGDNIDDSAFAMALAQEALTGEDSDTDIGTLMGPAMAACPDVMTEILAASFTAETGTELPAGAKDCIAGYVESNAQAIADALSSGDEGTDTLGAGLNAACPELAGGG